MLDQWPLFCAGVCTEHSLQTSHRWSKINNNGSSVQKLFLYFIIRFIYQLATGKHLKEPKQNFWVLRPSDLTIVSLWKARHNTGINAKQAYLLVNAIQPHLQSNPIWCSPITLSLSMGAYARRQDLLDLQIVQGNRDSEWWLSYNLVLSAY